MSKNISLNRIDSNDSPNGGRIKINENSSIIENAFDVFGFSSVTLDNLSVSGETNVAVISASTIISGSTNLYDIFLTSLSETDQELLEVVNLPENTEVVDTDILRISRQKIKYGYLYNWYAVGDARLIVSDDNWSIPSVANIDTLSSYLGTLGITDKTSSLSTNYNLWEDGVLRNGINFNLTGFNALPSGERRTSIHGGFIKESTSLFFWLSNVYLTLYAWHVDIEHSELPIGMTVVFKTFGKSVRLVRPATVAEQELDDFTRLTDYVGNNGQEYRTVKIGTQVWTSESLVETEYRDGTAIPVVTDQTAWDALITGARCSYDNDEDNVFLFENYQVSKENLLKELTEKAHTQNTDTKLAEGTGDEVSAEELRTHVDDTEIHLSEEDRINLEVVDLPENTEVINKDILRILKAKIKYGYLYNWYAFADVRNITSGNNISAYAWRVPEIANWQTLSNYIISLGYTDNDAAVLAGGFDLWDDGLLRNDADFGLSGLNILPGGYRSGSIGEDISYYALFWSLTDADGVNKFYCRVHYNDASLTLNFVTTQDTGQSIRLYRNATPTEQALADFTEVDNYVGNNGQQYIAIKIGTQVWTAENLIETHYQNGDAIPVVTNGTEWQDLTTGARCSNMNDEDNAFLDDEFDNYQVSKENLLKEVNEKADGKLALNQTIPETLTASPIINTLTASELVATDATKKLQSLGVATYPSLLELSYVKGSESNLQDQITTLGIGLLGTNYLFVQGNGTPTENGTELSTAYATAKTMTPNGNPLSANNRVTIKCGAGLYNFATALAVDTSFIDIVSITGNRDLIFSVDSDNEGINITANDTFVKGIDVGTKRFTFATGLSGLIIENCKGGDYSFGSAVGVIDISGTIKDCIGGSYSFGYTATGDVTISGTIKDCVGQDYSFGYSEIESVTISGTIKDCVGGDFSFGVSYYAGVTISGLIEGCNALDLSFGNAGYDDPLIISGTIRDCVGGDFSFGCCYGGDVTISGLIERCTAEGQSFGYSGGGDNALVVTISGILRHCNASAGNSFGICQAAGTVTISGLIEYCFCADIGGGSFGVASDTTGTVIISGTLNNCVGGGTGSFATIGNIKTFTGKLYNCRAQSGDLPTPTLTGRIRACIDGSDIFYSAIDPI